MDGWVSLAVRPDAQSKCLIATEGVCQSRAAMNYLKRELLISELDVKVGFFTPSPFRHTGVLFIVYCDWAKPYLDAIGNQFFRQRGTRLKLSLELPNSILASGQLDWRNPFSRIIFSSANEQKVTMRETSINRRLWMFQIE